MKKMISGVLCAIGVLCMGCDMEVPTDQVGSFTLAEFCGLTGGIFDTNTNHCTCGGVDCGENVTCVVDANSSLYVCMGMENLDYPQYVCNVENMTVCFDRVANVDLTSPDNGQTSGYYVTCDGNTWGAPKQCANGYSCKSYMQDNFIPSTTCGDCQNNGITCIRGQKVTDRQQPPAQQD